MLTEFLMRISNYMTLRRRGLSNVIYVFSETVIWYLRQCNHSWNCFTNLRVKEIWVICCCLWCSKCTYY